MLNGWLKRLLPAVLLLAFGGGQATGNDRPGMITVGTDAQAIYADCTFMDALKNTLKIRKAHLVRPDLIPFPVDRSRFC